MLTLTLAAIGAGAIFLFVLALILLGATAWACILLERRHAFFKFIVATCLIVLVIKNILA